jgi:hypothetical protein
VSEFDESHRDFRHAMNESVHRTMNEQRRRGNSPAATSMRCECECHRAGCGDSFVIAMDAYEAVRANGRRFVVTPGHQHESETIISTTEDYFVIEKAGEQGRISDSLKPR